jgi:deoxyhypusine synthase
MPKANTRTTTSLASLHQQFVRALAALAPTPIRGTASAADVEARDAYMRRIYQIVVADYLESVLNNTWDHLPANEADSDDIVYALGDGLSDDDYDVISELAKAGVHFGGHLAAAA